MSYATSGKRPAGDDGKEKQEKAQSPRKQETACNIHGERCM